MCFKAAISVLCSLASRFFLLLAPEQLQRQEQKHHACITNDTSLPSVLDICRLKVWRRAEKWLRAITKLGCAHITLSSVGKAAAYIQASDSSQDISAE